MASFISHNFSWSYYEMIELLDVTFVLSTEIAYLLALIGFQVKVNERNY